MELSRTIQCKNCPWKKDADLSKIPRYKRTKHKNLKDTISDGNFNPSTTLNVMACHESSDTNNQTCIGWIHNQVNNNNINLRLALRKCSQAKYITIEGEQLSTFEDTLRSN